MKWLHTLGSLALGALAIALPSLQTLVSAHPAVSGVLAAAYAILGHLLPSPMSDPLMKPAPKL